jgi:hypothetical protein
VVSMVVAAHGPPPKNARRTVASGIWRGGLALESRASTRPLAAAVEQMLRCLARAERRPLVRDNQIAR